MFFCIHFLSPKIKGGTLLKQKATISDWGFKVLPLHHNLTVSAVAGEGEQTRRESRARCGSQWTNRPRPTNRTHAIPIALAESSGIDRPTLSLAPFAILLSKYLGQGRKREEITRVTFWPRMPLVVRQICKSSAILRPKFPPLSPPPRAHTPLTTFRTWGSEEMRSFSLGWATCPPSVEPGQGWEYYE